LVLKLTFSGSLLVEFQALDELYYVELAELAAGEGDELLEALNADLATPFPTVAVLSVSVSVPEMAQGCLSVPVTNGVNCSGVGLSVGDTCKPSCVAGYRPSPEVLTCEKNSTFEFICNPVVTDMVVSMRVCSDALKPAVPTLTSKVAAYLGVEALDVRADMNVSNASVAKEPEPLPTYDLQGGPSPQQPFFGWRASRKRTFRPARRRLLRLRCRPRLRSQNGSTTSLRRCMSSGTRLRTI
jgi:hypothetical protein